MAGQRLRLGLESLGPDLPRNLPPLAWLLGLPADDDPVWARLGPPQRRRQLLDAVLTLVTAQAERGPLLILFEDLHWADAESRGGA